MAEITTATQKSGGKGTLRRVKKQSTKVDLTPMVDLGFLLITFFIITTTWTEAKAMNLYLPKGDIEDMPVKESTALTILAISDNKVFYYHGNLQEALLTKRYGVTNFTVFSGIGTIIRQKQEALSKKPGSGRKDLMLVIKPTPLCNYQNITDAMDEVLINDVKHYALLDINADEKKALLQLNIR